MFNLDEDMDFVIEEIGTPVTINDLAANVIINSVATNRNFVFDDKKILSRDDLKRGDIVNYLDTDYLVISDIRNKRYRSTYFKGIMRPTENLNITLNGVTHKINMYTERIKNSVANGQLISYDNSGMEFTVPYSEITALLKVNFRIIKYNQLWKIFNVDVSQSGLVRFACERESGLIDDEDMENEIVDNIVDDVEVPEPTDPVDPVEPETPDPEEPEETLEIQVKTDRYGYDDNLELHHIGSNTTYTARLVNSEGEIIEDTFTFSITDINRTSIEIESQDGIDSALIVTPELKMGTFKLVVKANAYKIQKVLEMRVNW